MYIVAFLLATLTPLAAQPDRFGTPACSAPGQELAQRSSFLLCHSSSLKVPIWAAYELLPRNLAGMVPRPKHFRHDASLAGTGAYDTDYRNSGFNRGHMVPAADAASSEESMRATFLLSNAAPQRAQLNSGKWSQLEKKVRRLAAEADVVYVFTGPLFEDPAIETIGPGHVAVPSSFFKVVLVIQGDRKTMYAAIVPNATTLQASLDHYAVAVEEVQLRTGLDFFSTIEPSEQHRLESVRNTLPR